MINKYPYTDFHELNLDAFFKQFHDLKEYVDNYDVEVQQYVDQWLTEHPEATTTIQDGSITEPKFSEALKLKTIKDYVTPQMFGAKGDGVTDDANAINQCIAYAIANDKMVIFPSADYAIESAISISNSINIDFGHSNIIYTGSILIDDLIIYGFVTSAAFKTHNGLKNLNIDGNANVKNCLHITGGKGIRLENISIVRPTEYGLLIDNSDNAVWELYANNITVNARTDSNTQALAAIKIYSISDSFLENIYAVNGSVAWFDLSTSGCTFTNLHGYSYPDTFTVGSGLINRGSGNRFVNTIIDTFTAVGISNTAPFNSYIDTTFARPANNSCIGFNDTSNYAVIDGVFCSDPITLISSSARDAITVKNITTYGTMVKDVDLTANEIPYHFAYDNSGRATTPIARTVYALEEIDLSALTLTGCTLTSNPRAKALPTFIKLSFGIQCTATSFVIPVGVPAVYTQNLIGYNRTTGKPFYCSYWADGTIHNIDTPAVNDIIYFDGIVLRYV